MREISRQLYLRGMHRMFGNPTLGTISGFLTVIFMIRSSVNLYFISLISTGGSEMSFRQIGAGWYLYIGAYIILCSSLSTVHISFALPKKCFLELSAGMSKFKSIFIKQSVLTRPMNILILIMTVTGSLIFLKFAKDVQIVLNGIIIILISIIGAYLIFKLACRLSVKMYDIQILESLLLIFLVRLNPDVMQSKGTVLLLINGLHLKFDSPLITFFSIFCIFITSVILIIFVKTFTIINNSFQNRRSSDPMKGWYWKFFKLKYWFLLYILIIPAMYFPILSKQIRLQTAVIFMFFTIISFVFFIINCENSIKERWRSSMLTKKNVDMLLKPFFIHLILTIIPLSGLLFK